MNKELPLWSLESIYPTKGRDFSEEGPYRRARKRLAEEIQGFSEFTNPPREGDEDIEVWVSAAIDKINLLGDLYEELSSYLYARYSTDTRDTETLKELNGLEGDAVALKTAQTRFRNALGALGDEETIHRLTPKLKEAHFFLSEELYYYHHQMSPDEENLAAELGRSGVEAWARLQESLSSTVSTLWDEASGEKKTVVELRTLAYAFDPKIRERAYRKELELWKQVEIPLAAALNGIKGTSLSLAARRNYADPLEASLKKARISRATLDALVGVMTDNLSVFRKYLKAKARYLGKESLAFFDLFAPLEDAEGGAAEWTFDRAQDFIVLQFSRFSPEMGDFAAKAFEEGWIDAAPREGKVGGAYCTSFPLARESRILCNFDGSFDSLITVAHELGHAYHHHLLRDAPSLARQYPMTLAETASIFAENVVFNQAYEQAAPKERLPILETYLTGATQVIVDILSRFQFEKAVFERRVKGDLGAEEFCQLMVNAQKAAYGDALDPSALHPYMWAVKGHYYIPELDFYNFPYTFGQLFGMGLYGLYQERGESFTSDYRRILRRTGLADAEEVTGQAGFDITKRGFWQTGVDSLARWVEEYVKFTEAVGAKDDR